MGRGMAQGHEKAVVRIVVDAATAIRAAGEE